LRRKSTTTLVAASASALACLHGTAFAQESEPPRETFRVEVTGSNIHRADVEISESLEQWLGTFLGDFVAHLFVGSAWDRSESRAEALSPAPSALGDPVPSYAVSSPARPSVVLRVMFVGADGSLLHSDQRVTKPVKARGWTQDGKTR
jgi:hypothetical protein